MLITAGQRVHVAAMDRLRPFTSQCIKMLSVPLLQVRVVGFLFDRTTASGTATGLANAIAKHKNLSHSYSHGTAVVSTSSAIKSLFLRHVELKSNYTADRSAVGVVAELRFPTGSKDHLDCRDERAAMAQCLVRAFSLDNSATGSNLQELIEAGIKSSHLQCFPRSVLVFIAPNHGDPIVRGIRRH